jgi:dTDP-4-dehydrorhamnose reductase
MSAESLEGILITGSSGQVGGALVRVFAPLHSQLGPVHAPLRAELDLADPDSIRRAVRALRPRWILNPAAYTAVDRAESEPELAYRINADAVGVLGEEAAKLGSAVVHFSTDYVFDGTCDRSYTEQDQANPQTVYGASKLAGEQALAASGAGHLIVRTSWVYGATGSNFLRTVLRLARERPEIRIVSDQHGAPTWSRSLALTAAKMIQVCETAAHGRRLVEAVDERQGVYHAASAGETTWFGFAEEALRLARAENAGAKFATLTPIATSDYPTHAARPLNSRLNCAKLGKVFGVQMGNWSEALKSVMNEIARDDHENFVS